MCKDVHRGDSARGRYTYDMAQTRTGGSGLSLTGAPELISSGAQASEVN